MRTTLKLTLILLTMLSARSMGQETGTDPTAADGDEPIQRIAIIGASASAGFGVVVEQAEGVGEPYAKTMLKMQDLYMAADGKADLVYLDLSGHMFFSRPRSYGRSMVDRLQAWKPDLVFGVDFLFWFVFGVIPEEKRLEFLEVGLGMLDELASQGIPMVIGEVPDLEGTESFVISSRQIPLRSTVIEANKRINEWAADRDNVAVVPLQVLTEQLSSGGELVIGPHHWKPEAEGIRMIAADKLHPTFDGMICLAQAVEVAARSIDSIQRSPGRLPPMQLDRDDLVVRMRVRRLKPRIKTRSNRATAQYLSRRPRSRFWSVSVVAISSAALTDSRAPRSPLRRMMCGIKRLRSGAIR